MDLDETLVAQAFATSSVVEISIQSFDRRTRIGHILAPLLKASSKAKKVPIAKIYVNWSSIVVNCLQPTI